MDGKPAWGQETFFIQPRALNMPKIYFSVFTEYRWHADTTHYGGSTWSWNPHFENRANQGNQKSYEWCEYPGPNEFTS